MKFVIFILFFSLILEIIVECEVNFVFFYYLEIVFMSEVEWKKWIDLVCGYDLLFFFYFLFEFG